MNPARPHSWAEIGFATTFVHQCLTALGRAHRVAALFNNAKHHPAMEIVLRKYGNSTVAVLPPAVLRDLGLSAGQHMTLSTTDDGQIVLARKRKYVLSDLIAQCNPKAPAPEDLDLWDTAGPVGREVW
jgi:antitoxin ChpS